GRPQFDVEGHVYGLAHEDDVKIGRWREKFDQIPADTKDPGLRKAKKALKKKMPKRRATQQYWEESHFTRLIHAEPGKLQSRGALPWRLLAYLLEAIPDIDRLRELIRRRLVEGKQQEAGQRELDSMLMTLWRAGYVDLEPEPPATEDLHEGPGIGQVASGAAEIVNGSVGEGEPKPYQPVTVLPRPELSQLLLFRGTHPLFGVFLIKHLGIADRFERIQAMESVLAMPRSIGPQVWVPGHDELPPGPLATMRLDVQLLQMGLVNPAELSAEHDADDEEDAGFDEGGGRVLTLAEKLRLLFDFEFPGVHGVQTVPVWVAGELLEWGGDFNKYITGKRLQKQEGVIFRHLLRLLLLLGEFSQLTPPDVASAEWRADLFSLRDELERTCRQVDPTSTDKMMAESDRNGT
ncbi:MAG: helicase, partial [Pirellulales bacterium]|nr:helicase [Pirellulales bacterium]